MGETVATTKPKSQKKQGNLKVDRKINSITLVVNKTVNGLNL